MKWLGQHWLLVFSLAYGAFVVLPWLAPTFMHLGWSAPGRAIYFLYTFFCHQLPQRSFFLFGEKTMYSLADAGLGAFSVFFTQSPSFLAGQRNLKLRKGRSNAENLFGLRNIPSDNQIRNLLDPISPMHLERYSRQTFRALEQTDILKGYRSFANQLLVAMDGTEYFSSKKIHCQNCSHRILKNGESNYFHSALTPVIVQSGNEHVISLEAEYIVPQDGHEKQDCETQAGKRWVEKHGAYYAKRGVTLLGDDLYSRQPFCQALKDKHLHFILVCKADSHANLYETVDFCLGQ